MRAECARPRLDDNLALVWWIGQHGKARPRHQIHVAERSRPWRYVTSSSWHSSLSQVRLLCLRLLQPVRHAQLAVHRRRGGEMLSGRLALVRAVVELTEAEVTVGDEGRMASSVVRPTARS
jgi:hypothetical protein